MMLPRTLSFNPAVISLSPSKSPSFAALASYPLQELIFSSFKRCLSSKSCLKTPKCSITVVEGETKELEARITRPSSAEVSRTIVELSSQGTLSALTPEGWPLGIGVRFAADDEGSPILSLNSMSHGASIFSTNDRSSLHIQLEGNGFCTPQCTLQGSLSRPEGKVLRKRLGSIWNKRFEKEVGEDFLYVMTVERVLHMDNFKEDGIWVTEQEYRNAIPDPLRTCAKSIVNEMNDRYMEDIERFCSIFVDLEFQVVDARMTWIDRLGFDLQLHTSEEDVFVVRIPFLREVTDEKAAKSSLTYLSQLAWEVEKNYSVPEFEKVKCLKKITT